MKICDWQDFEARCSDLFNTIRQGKKVTPALQTLAVTTDLDIQRKAAEIYVNDRYSADHSPIPAARHAAPEKIRIGYYSADFRNHPVSVLTAGVYENHDRSRFEVFAFSFGPDSTDSMRKRLESAFDHFIDITGRSDSEVAQLSRDTEIDIAIDLGGFTTNSRAGIFAHRAAPVQINYIGYPCTMGAGFID